MGGFTGIVKQNLINEEEIAIVKEMHLIQNYRTKGLTFIKAFEKAAFACGTDPDEWGIPGYYAVLDGNIYNYEELKAELAGYRSVLEVKTHAELLAAMYAEYGSGFICKLRGLFSFLVYDIEKNLLSAVRDSFATKPLFYRKTSNSAVFSSEIKGLSADKSYDGIKINKELLQHYLSYQYVPEPETICGDIFCVKKGSYIIFGKETETVIYNKTHFTPKKSILYDEKKFNLKTAIEKSVEVHMADNANIGAFLSSGVDSAVITALASKIRPGIKAFTASFDVKGYSELDDASTIANKFDIEHIKLKFTIEDFIENFEKVILHLDTPVGDPSVTAIYLMNREAAKHVDVVLAGEGSDEMFGGYRVYGTALTSDKIYKLPGFIKSFLSVFSKILPRGGNMIKRGCIPVEKRFIGNSFVFEENEKKDILKHFNPLICYTDKTKNIYDEAAGYSTLLKMQYCDLHTWMPGDICVKGDRLSAANGLELRTPYVDREVFKAASILCDKDKINKKTTKYIFRDAFRNLLGEDIIWRPKLGFPVPTRQWLKDELYDWAADIFKNNTADKYIDTAACLKLLEEHRTGQRDLYHPLWTLISIITWHKLFIHEKQ